MEKATMEKVANEIRTLVATFVPMLRELDDSKISVRAQPEKWARKEVLGHLIDSACNNQQKFVRMMAQPHLDFVGYKQDEWVEHQNYAVADWEWMVRLWESYNQHVAYLIETIDSKYYSHTIKIDDAGPFTLGFIMPDYVEHMKHHLRQIFPDVDLENKFVNVYGA